MHHPQLDLENLFQVFRPKSLEHHSFVDAVHELGREFPPCRFDCGAIDFLIQAGVHFGGFMRETESPINQVAHLTCAQVRSHDDDALRKIDAPVIAQGQSSFIQDAEQ